MDELQRYKERLHIALNAAKICIFEVDLTRQLYTFFENAEVIFGVSGDKILKDVRSFQTLDPEAYRRACSEYFSHPDDEDVIQEAFSAVLRGETVTYEARMRAGGSAFIWCRIDAVPIIRDGVPSRMIGVITDIAEQREKTEQLQQAAWMDDFTGLCKKGHAIQQIESILQRRKKETYALIILDIDNFKVFNDTYGHDRGDRIIREVARIMKREFQDTDILSRFGGDEFLIFLPFRQERPQLPAGLEKLIRFEADGLICTNSIGVALYPQDGSDFGELFHRADQALYRAKESKACVVFSSQTGGDE